MPKRLYGLPTWFYKSIFDIPYEQLKIQGIKALFFDLDNTLIDYKQKVLDEKTKQFIKNIQQDFYVLIISNNNHKRVSRAVGNDIPFVSSCKKPFKGGIKKAITLSGVDKNDIIVIGDQVWTDIHVANKLNLKSILVLPILKKTDHLSTKLSRLLAKRLINQVKKYDLKAYQSRLEYYDTH